MIWGYHHFRKPSGGNLSSDGWRSKDRHPVGAQTGNLSERRRNHLLRLVDWIQHEPMAIRIPYKPTSLFKAYIYLDQPGKENRTVSDSRISKNGMLPKMQIPKTTSKDFNGVVICRLNCCRCSVQLFFDVFWIDIFVAEVKWTLSTMPWR